MGCTCSKTGDCGIYIWGMVNLGLGRRMILNWLLKKTIGGLEVDSLSPGRRLVLGSCDHGERNRDPMTMQGICRLA
jgi:hypothetical protein